MPKSTKHTILGVIPNNPAFARWLRLLNRRINKKVDGIEHKVDMVEEKIDGLTSYPEKKIDAVSDKVGVVGSAIGKKVDAVNRKVHEVGCKVEKKIDVVDEKIGAVCDKVDVIGGVSVEKIDVIGDKVDEIGHATENKIDAVCDKVDVVGGVVVEKIDAARDTVDAVDEKIDAVGDRIVKKADAVSDRIVGKVDAVGDRIVEKVDAVGGVREKKIDVVGDAVGAVDEKIGKVGEKVDAIGGKVNEIPSLLAGVIRQIEKRDWTLARQLRFSNTRIAKKVDALDSKVGGKVDALGDKVEAIGGSTMERIDAVGDAIGVADKKIDVVGRKINATGDRVLARVGTVENKVDTVLSCINARSESHCGFWSNGWRKICRLLLWLALVFGLTIALLVAAFLIGVNTNKELDNEAFSFTSAEKLCVAAGAFSFGSIPLLSGYFEECRETLDNRFTVIPKEGSYLETIALKENTRSEKDAFAKERKPQENSSTTKHTMLMEIILGYGIVFILTAILTSSSLAKMLVWDSCSKFGLVSGTLAYILAMLGFSFYAANYVAEYTSTIIKEESCPTQPCQQLGPYVLHMKNMPNYETGEYLLSERFEGKPNGLRGRLDKLAGEIKNDVESMEGDKPNALIIEGHTDGSLVWDKDRKASASKDIDKELQTWATTSEKKDIAALEKEKILYRSNIELGYLRAFFVRRYLLQRKLLPDIEYYLLASFSCARPSKFPEDSKNLFERCPKKGDDRSKNRKVVLRPVRIEPGKADHIAIPIIKQTSE
uniref:Uncharacterized protein n=1 Tax=Candidatus Kentrum sp. TC TaxID=2126339 RepID=A0A450ZTZ4_9GAMM|nr:MAG: hypothetical protein BECKTC1821F_GA0114240_101619 [Candidatus Kentron sp. TC]